MDIVNILGFLAGTLTTLSLLPQTIKSLKTKHTDDISLAMFVMLALGIVLWLIYGILLKAAPLILANSISLVLILMLIGLKLRHG